MSDLYIEEIKTRSSYKGLNIKYEGFKIIFRY